jgi:quercetin dioxygenase-like cupin family protein
MHVKRSLEVPAEPMKGLPGVTVRWLWAAPDGAPTFALRLFELEPGASTPHHSHAHEHEVYILSGHAQLRGSSGLQTLDPGDTVLVRPYDEHQFINNGLAPLRFLCGIPILSDPPK